MSGNWGQNINAAEAYSHQQRKKKKHDGALGEMEQRAKGVDGKIIRMMSDAEVDEALLRPEPKK